MFAQGDASSVPRSASVHWLVTLPNRFSRCRDSFVHRFSSGEDCLCDCQRLVDVLFASPRSCTLPCLLSSRCTLHRHFVKCSLPAASLAAQAIALAPHLRRAAIIARGSLPSYLNLLPLCSGEYASVVSHSSPSQFASRFPHWLLLELVLFPF